MTLARPILALLLAGAAFAYAQEDARAHYAPILERDPFRPRSFVPPAPPKQPARVALQVTCVFAVAGGDQEALVEEPGTGRGLFVRAGQERGDLAVASVTTEGLVARLPEGTKAIPLGGRISVREAGLDLETLASTKNTGWRDGVPQSNDGQDPPGIKHKTVNRGDSK